MSLPPSLQAIYDRVTNANRNLHIRVGNPREIDWNYGVPNDVLYDCWNKLTVFINDIPKFKKKYSNTGFAENHVADGWNYGDDLYSEKVSALRILSDAMTWLHEAKFHVELLRFQRDDKNHIHCFIWPKFRNDEFPRSWDFYDICLWVYCTPDQEPKLLELLKKESAVGLRN